MQHINEKHRFSRSSSSTLGLIIIFVGLALLVDNLGILPDWVFRWSTVLILVGLYLGSRHQYKSTGWIIIVMIGVYFTLEAALPSIDLSKVIIPVMLLLLGAILIARPKHIPLFPRGYNFRKNKVQSPTDEPATSGEEQADSTTSQGAYQSADYVSAINIFGASQQVIYSKTLQGGELTSVFGGGDINFVQADFENELVLNVTAVFGGIKIIVPPHWQVKSEVSAVFGGVEDKRGLLPIEQITPKILVLRGMVMFGGLEIKSF